MSPPSRARTVGLAVLGGIILGALIGFALRAWGDDEPADEPITASTTSMTAAGSPATTTFVPDPIPAPPETTAPAAPTDAAPATTAPTAPTAGSPNADPATVVRGFIGAWLSWTWSDTPDPNTAARERVRPWVSPGLADRLAQSSGAAHLTSLRMAAHETATPEVVSIDQPEPNRYLSLVTVHVQRDDTGATKQSRYVDVRLVEAGGGWYVDEIMP